jgi:hypothetical protein
MFATASSSNVFQFPPLALPEMTTPRKAVDRATAVAVAVLQISATAPPRERQQRIEQYLRQEFEDERRQAIADRELADA